MNEKKSLNANPVHKKVQAELNFRLASDFDRYDNGSIVMCGTNATFTLPSGEAGSVGVDLGGTLIDVQIGKRNWVVKMEDIVGACLKMDAQYLLDNPIPEVK